MVRLPLLLYSVACAALPSVAQAQSKIAGANWQKGPRIDSVRAVVRWVDGFSSTLTVQVDSTVCDEGHVALVSKLFTDSGNVVRRFTVLGGSDESAGQEQHYYDGLGTLRFTFAETSAGNGTRREDRYYYDASGTLIYHDERILRGPGYTGGFIGLPVRDPRGAFLAGCRQHDE
jgi:hypothetical protein